MSMVTVGSPASILATRDWLDFTILASSAWVRCLLSRLAFSFSVFDGLKMCMGISLKRGGGEA